MVISTTRKWPNISEAERKGSWLRRWCARRRGERECRADVLGSCVIVVMTDNGRRGGASDKVFVELVGQSSRGNVAGAGRDILSTPGLVLCDGLFHVNKVISRSVIVERVSECRRHVRGAVGLCFVNCCRMRATRMRHDWCSVFGGKRITEEYGSVRGCSIGDADGEDLFWTITV